MTRAFRLTTPSIVSLADHFFSRCVARTKVHESWLGVAWPTLRWIQLPRSRPVATYQDIKGTQKVRNAFAHPRGFLDFDSPEVDASIQEHQALADIGGSAGTV